MSDFARLDDYLRRWRRCVGVPGLAAAVTDGARTVYAAGVGYADAAARQPVAGATTFQIGSIGKSMTALAVMQLVEAGRLDLEAPLSTHLSWFAPAAAASSQYEPIALKHILSHTAGLPAGSDFTPAARYESYALREVRPAWEPGSRFHYSNTGYKLLGCLLEDVEGAAYGDILRRRVLGPVGMDESDAVITHRSRQRMASGYVPLYDDRPDRQGDTLIPATWMEYGAGDGSVAATAGDLARYARLWLNRGRVGNRALVAPATYDRIIAPAITMARGDDYEHDYGYGFGIISHTAGGHRYIGHGGSTVGFQAIMLVDLTAGLAAVLLCNGGGADTYAPARYALAVADAVKSGMAVPGPPPLPDATRIDDARRYAGVYIDADTGGRVMVDADGHGLRLAGVGRRLERIGGNTFCVPDDGWDPFPLRFISPTGAATGGSADTGADGGAGDGVCAEIHHGAAVYVRDGISLPDCPPYPREWAALAGHYRSHAPYVSNFRVVLRRGRLYLAWPGGGEEGLTPESPGAPDGSVGGWFGVGPAGMATPERVRFGPIVGGKALRAQWVGGGDFYRVGG